MADLSGDAHSEQDLIMPVPPGRKVSILLALVLFVSPAQALVHPTLFSTSLLRGNSHFRNIDSPVQHPNAQQARLVRSSAQSAVVSSSSPAGRGYFSVCRSTLSTRHASPSVDISTRQSHGGGSEEPLSRSEALSTLFDGMGCAIAVTLAGTSRARADGADGLGVVDDLLADCPSVSFKVEGRKIDFMRQRRLSLMLPGRSVEAMAYLIAHCWVIVFALLDTTR